ncbi:MAG: hydroxylamine reductase [Planctomycetota bacterium]|nr:MAG: hydroxylamine reductase [Planctomycetota bacterium]REJ93358.1 MAG: hydroxylamine reductase [Planctomycetota bacterium]REK25442.1 MAG: hydroxylamine reductase [Planctomycetota bacterium]REK40854.1 MAG: hydroxylamine reductase [Planctomycetota bacterium]
MYCNQCEQTANGTGCVDLGVCGKDPDMQSLQETLLYGVKGMAAYAHHARRLGKVDEEVNAFIEEALFATVTNVNFDLDSLLEMVLECGRMNLKVMEMLDAGHTEKLGTPEPTVVYEGTKAGPGILVTGHDLVDMADLLEQAADAGVNVYTHGEMLPAHSYPKLKAHPHLAGHFGTAWQNQQIEFSQFSGPILATTNCVLIPWESYKDRLFTTRVTAVPGGTRLTSNDFSQVIEKAKQCAPLPENKVGESSIGFHHSVVLGLADKIIDAVKSGDIKHFYLVGGCDGAEAGRNYFTKVAHGAPDDAIVLTLGCGKFRVRDHEYGTVAGLPRLLDMGQCNDAYGAIKVATALADAFECGVNELPLTLVISWFEQKAVAVLLTLLHLGVSGIRLGPAPPAFITPNVFQILQDKFDLKLIESEPPRELFQLTPA